MPRSASELKPIVSPSPSIRSKHQTLAQKLRSTGKSVKGYMNLNETPVVSECLTPSLSEFERITPMKPIDEVDSNIVSMTPRCWKTVYHLLELYARMPETKTVTQRISFGVDVSEGYKGTKKYDILPEAKSCDDIDKDGSTSTPVPPVSQLNPSKFFHRLSLVTINFIFVLIFYRGNKRRAHETYGICCSSDSSNKTISYFEWFEIGSRNYKFTYQFNIS